VDPRGQTPLPSTLFPSGKLPSLEKYAASHAASQVPRTQAPCFASRGLDLPQRTDERPQRNPMETARPVRVNVSGDPPDPSGAVPGGECP